MSGFVVHAPRSEHGATAPAEVVRALGPDACAALERIAGDRPFERLVVGLSAAVVLLARCERARTVPVALPGRRVAIVEVDDQLDLDAHIARVDAAVRTGFDALGPAELGTNFGVGSPALPGAELGASVDLLLNLDGDRLRFVHAPSFSPDYAAELATCVEHLLAQFDRGQRPLAELSTITAATRDRLAAFNGGYAPGQPASLRTRLRAAVAEHEDRVAIRAPVRLRYGELLGEARALAAELERRLGPLAGARIGLRVDKSPAAIVAIVAIVELGAVWVPVSSEQPRERAARIFADAGVVVVLDDGSAGEALTGLACPSFDLGALHREVVGARGPAPEHPLRPDDPAYLIFTSGSTGAAKGVLVSHRAIVAYLDWKLDYYGFDPSFVLLQIPSLGFDSSISDLFSTLLSGGSMVVLDEHDRRSPTRIDAAIRAHGITNLTVVPSFHRVLLPTLAAHAQQLKLVTIAGEPASLDLICTHRRLLPATRLVNEYGPTENAVGASAEDYRDGPLPGEVIGKPQSNTRVHVLDEALRPVPIGAIGELCLAGVSVAEGYVGASERDAASFVHDPELPALRMYRSGDLGRWRPDGRLEIHGRVDAQIKIRGQRIEPGEIEAALRELGAADAVVAARPGHRGELELIAWAVGAGGWGVEQLEKRLPATMIPRRLIWLDEFPRTVNGKIDHDALPEPAAVAPVCAREGSGDELFELVRLTWAEQLGCAVEGPEADFFDLGGSSLVAIEVILNLQARVELELDVWELLDRPRLGDFVEWLRDHTHAALRRISTAPPAADYPASWAQERLYFLALADPDNRRAYSIPDAMRLRGPLDPAHWQQALDALVARHELLRTELLFGPDGQLRQRIHPTASLRMGRRKLASEAELEEVLRELAATELAVDAVPPVHAQLLELGREDHVLVVVAHHLVIDGWAARVLWRDLFELVAARGEARRAQLPELRVQYKDIAVWQRGRGLDDDARRWWQTRLAGPLPTRWLLTDERHDLAETREVRVIARRLPAVEVAALRRRAGAARTTCFVLLTAVVGALIARYCDEDEVLLGTPLVGRDHPDFADQLGPLLDTLVLRFAVAPGDSLDELIVRVAAALADGLAHQPYPYAALVRDLELERTRAGDPLLSVMVAVDEPILDDPQPLVPPSVSALAVERVPVLGGMAKLPLLFNFDLGAPELSLTLEYDRAWFRPERASRIVEHLERALAEALDPRPCSLTRFAAPSEAELAKICGFERGPTRPLVDTTLDPWFSRIAARRSSELALIHDERGWTYADLVRARDRLVAALMERGVAVGERVAIRGARSPALVAAMLACARRGAPFLLLDPDDHSRRQLDLIAAAQIRLVIADEPVDELPRVPMAIATDGDAPFVDAIAEPGPGDPVYLAFTSGSTGAPRGVAVSHASLTNLVAWHVEALGVEPTSRAAWLGALGFDATFEELWPYLLAGATVAIAPTQVREDPDRLIRWLDEAGITHADLPTPLAVLVLERGADRLAPELRLMVGGEALPTLAQVPVELWNAYGPTEATVTATAGLVAPGVTPDIGRPISNVEIRLLDRRGQRVPLGWAGELWIAGVGVATPLAVNSQFGCLSCDERGGDERGGRAYRSGDRAAWTDDGRLRFLGRVDDQLEILGHRVEPAEVEAVARTVSGVEEAAVFAHAGRLCAAIVGVGARLEAVREAFAVALPSWLRPAHIELLEALPRLASGKLDRRALARRASLLANTGGDPPCSPLEQVVAATWTEILGCPSVPRDVDFFALGGDSLASMRLLVALRDRGLHAELGDLLAEPTVAGQARRLASRGSFALNLPHRAEPRPCAALVRVLEVEHAFGDAAAHVMVDVVEILGSVDLDLLRAAYAQVYAGHELLRCSFTRDDHGRGWRVHPDVHSGPSFRVLDLAGSEPRVRARAAIATELARPFELAREPSIRVLLLELDAHRRLLVTLVHHAVADGWSLALIQRDLYAAWTALREPGSAVRSRPPPIAWLDYSAWLDDEPFAAELDATLMDLAGPLPPLDLALDHARVARQSFMLAQHDYVIDARLRAALERHARANACSVFVVLLASFALLLFERSTAPEVRIGTLLSGRARPELDDVVGLLVNTAVLRAPRALAADAGALVQHLRAASLAALARQELRFERVLAALERRGDLNLAELFEVMFVMQSEPVSARPPPGLVIRRSDLVLPVAYTTSVDLILSIAERGPALEASLIYKRELFEPSTIAALAERHRAILAALVHHGDGDGDG